DQLNDVYTNVAKQQELDLAANQLATIPSLGSDITGAEIAEAFATTDLPYTNWSGSAADPTSEEFTLPGYPGPVLDAQALLAALQLGHGGAERELRLGLLKAEINCGKRDYSEALGLYNHLLISPLSGPPRPLTKFVAIRAALASLALADQLFRKQRVL